MHTSGGFYAWRLETSGQLGLSGIENQSFPIRSENAVTQEENFFSNRHSYVPVSRRVHPLVREDTW